MWNEDRPVELLDLCIDALVRGDEWRALVEGPEARQIGTLMVVAESIHEGAGTLPKPGPRQRLRIWDRIFNIRARLAPGDGPGQRRFLANWRFTSHEPATLAGRKSRAGGTPDQAVAGRLP